MPQLVNDFPSHVIAVGASTPLGGSLPSSNTGDLIQVFAPGQNVGAIKKEGGVFSVDRFDMTSVAAPFVAATAGLLISFDPGLSISEVKDHLMNGADSSTGIPILNAYESLKLAAERSGAPLCGNPVWATGGSLYTRRSEGSAPEALASSLGPLVGQVEVLHGGKYIRYRTPSDTVYLAWDASGGPWDPVAAPANAAQLRGGTQASVFGYSHDRDTLVRADQPAATRWYETQASQDYPLMRKLDGVWSEIGALPVNDLPQALERTCLERDPVDHECFLYTRETRGWLLRLAYPQFPTLSPSERLAHVTVSPLQVVRDSTFPWGSCSFDPTHECREVRFVQVHRDATIYRVDLESPALFPLETIPGETVFWIGHGESGHDVVLMRGRWQITLHGDAATYYQTGSPISSVTGVVEKCDIEYRERFGLNLIGDPIHAEEACNFGTLSTPSEGAGPGTIAPFVAPNIMAGGPTWVGTNGLRATTADEVSVPLPLHGHTLDGLVQIIP